MICLHETFPFDLWYGVNYDFNEESMSSRFERFEEEKFWLKLKVESRKFYANFMFLIQ